VYDSVQDRHDRLFQSGCAHGAVLKTVLTATSVNTPGKMLEASSESDAIWKRAITVQKTELQSNVFRMIVIVSRLSCRHGGGLLI
jgi:hypothetical protein